MAWTNPVNWDNKDGVSAEEFNKAFLQMGGTGLKPLTPEIHKQLISDWIFPLLKDLASSVEMPAVINLPKRLEPIVTTHPDYADGYIYGCKLSFDGYEISARTIEELGK